MIAIRTPAQLQELMGATHPLTEQQWSAVTAPLEPSVVIAGAGSGKTTLMAARVVYLVLTGQVSPEQVLGLTFTTKAASELRARIRTSLVAAGAWSEERAETEEALEPTVATYNAYAASLISDHGLLIGHEPDTRVITDASRYQLGARAVDRFTGPLEKISDHPPTVIQNLLALESAMSEHLVSSTQVRDHDLGERVHFERAEAEELGGKARKTYLGEIRKALSAIDRRAELLSLVESYRRLKAELGLMDFADQIALAARLASEHPEVGAAERARFRLVLLDEYQDTSVAQAQLLSRLFSGPTRDRGRGHVVTAVGDPNQAIYGWRGASVSNILGFAGTFPAVTGEVPVLPLTVNQRSDRRILEAATKLAEPLYAARPELAPLEARPGAAQGEVEVAVFETREEELTWVCEQVRAAHTGAWSDIGVLVRDNTTAEATYDVLSGSGIPVEIVGLKGLLRLPEVAEVVANLRLVLDITDNVAVLTLLSGPRWAIGPRDLRLLAQRAAELSGRPAGRTKGLPLEDEIHAIVDGVDPAELAALVDALDDPGEAAYSPQARERFALLSAELRALRAQAGDPILDLTRRIVEVTGVDVELASTASPAAESRRDNLDLFLKGVAEFQAIDGDVTLTALLAYLTAEDETGNGLDLATPSEADSVKLLTVHRAKGLEWDTVFCVGVAHSRFPSTQSRSLWTTSPAVLPAALRGDAADQAQLGGHDKQALDAYRAHAKARENEEELRLGYVAFTRAVHRLVVTSHIWGERPTPYGPSDYQVVLRDLLADWGEPDPPWLDRPPPKTPNPTVGKDRAEWPVGARGEESRRRAAAAAAVAACSVDAGAAPETDPDEGLDLVDAALVAEWDAELDRLLTELRSTREGHVEVPLPASLSATSLARLRDDPEAFARDLARPMPRPPSPQARFGTRFHAWVEERFGQLDLFDPDELSGRADVGIDDEDELRALIAAFEAGPFADRAPHAVEPGFALVLAGQVVRGRIDAVYLEPDGTHLVVDWKTNQRQSADPLQLAIYRLAWAELHDLPLEQVRAGFFYVRSGDFVEPPDLPGRAGLERLVTGSEHPQGAGGHPHLEDASVPVPGGSVTR